MSAASPDSASAPPGPRNEGIDLLRGLSIVLVVLHHLALRIPLRKSALAAWLPGWLLDALAYNGQEAVSIFFVISGFLIAANSLARWGTLHSIDVLAFWRRRAARIVPCLAVLVAVLALFHLAGVPQHVIDKPTQSLPQAIAAAFGLYLNRYEARTGYLPAGWDVLWSLSIEEAFYLGFPLACLAFARWRGLFVCLLYALALTLPLAHASAAGNAIWQDKAYLPGMAAIAMGVLAALVVDGGRPRRSTVRLTFWLGLLGLLAVLAFESLLWPLFHDGVLLLLTFAVGALLAALRWRERGGAPERRPATARRVSLATAWLRAFGRLSYEVYLTHMFAVWTIVACFRALGGDRAWGFLCYAPALLLAWLLGWLVERTISRPGARLLLGAARASDSAVGRRSLAVGA